MQPKALIVRVKISKLGQSEKDTELTDEIHRRYGLQPEAGSYTKAIYPAGVFKEVTSVEHKVRSWHKNQQGKRLILSSLGWICPAPHVDAYVDAMQKFEDEFWPAIDRVALNWDEILRKCREIQGARYNPDDYPPRDAVRGHFSYLRTMTPMPRPEAVADLDWLARERIADLEAQIQTSITAAMRDGSRQAMARVLRHVQHMADMLGKPDPTITDKLIETLTELLDLAPQLNLGNDAAISDLVRDCRAKLVVAPDALRESVLQRRRVATAARGIVNTFRMGGRKLAA